MFSHITLFFIAIVLSIICAFLGVGFGGVILGIVILFVLNTAILFYIVLFSRNLPLIMKILKIHKSEPSYAYVIALSKHDLDEAKNQLSKAITRYKNSPHKKSFESLLALLNGNLTAAKEFAIEIKDPSIQMYTLALIDTYDGQGEQHLHKQFAKPWMAPAIHATYYWLQGNKEKYNEAKEQTFKNSKGLQLASNVYSFEFNERNWNIQFK